MPLPCLAIEMNNQHMATTFHSHRKKSVCHVVIDIIWTVVEIGQTVMTHAFVGLRLDHDTNTWQQQITN